MLSRAALPLVHSEDQKIDVLAAELEAVDPAQFIVIVYMNFIPISNSRKHRIKAETKLSVSSKQIKCDQKYYSTFTQVTSE